MQRELNRAFADVLKCQRVVPVLTVADGEAGVALARALAEGGLRMIEVTLRTAGAIEILRRMAGVPGVIVGAGTVMTPAQADAVIAAGARFIVSPGATPALVAAANGWPVPYLPGVATAGEAMALGAEGYHALKFFPAEAAGGIAVLKALAAPLQDIVFCPTGGIDAAKAPAYLALPNVVAVGGSWVAPEKLIAKGAWAEITAVAREAAELAGSKDLPPMAAPVLPASDGAEGSTAAADDPGETSLMKRLRRLADPIRDIYINAAHIQELSDAPEFKEGVALLAAEDTPLDIVVEYACGDSAELSCVALAALIQRPDGDRAAARIAECFSGMDRSQLRFVIDLVGKADPVPLDALLARFRDWWVEDPRIALAFNELFTRLGERAPQTAGPAVKRLGAPEQAQLKELLLRIRHPAADILAAGLKSAPPLDPHTHQPLRSVLETTGRFWGELADPPGLFEPQEWKHDLAAAEAVLRRQPPRSLLVNGEPLAGKTSFLRLLAQKLAKSGWRVYEAGGADLQAGLPYIGQLEGRLRQLLDEIAVGNRVIWYVPDLLQLALSGTHQAQSASILDQILPALAEGRIVVLTEATPTSFARLMQLRPSLRRILEVVRLEPLDREPAIKLAGQLAAELGRAAKLKVDGDFPAAAVEAAEHYLSSSALPGSALSLVRLSVLKAESSTDRHLRAHSALETLAQMTGLPLSILDGSERLDMEKLRAFFTARVIGQPEAVESVVERVAMLKAGLNDPMKPIAVFLLAGPTGTGKTELAKALSDYLFGSVDRMIRLDMSEYQAADALTKIVGGPALPADVETLASRIRKQPFSLVLLDEFEKSAPQVWDLFLQVFDEGRLTDAQGQTADFRHSIIILTTNLGATRHQSSGFGFAPSRGVFTADQVTAAIGQTFRPEFQNRLDKVIVFQPLTRELMRGILKKELERLFQRRGLKARDWAIEWEASALEFLLEKGFTPEMGARPLKRAIDQYVVAPLAQTIVERRFPEGDQFVFMRSDGTSIRAEFVDPDGDGSAYVPVPANSGAAAGQAPTLSGIVLGARGSPAEISVLESIAETIETRLSAPEWTNRKTSLGSTMNAPDFWTRPDRAKPLAEFALMDRLEMAADTAWSLRSRLVRRRSDSGQGTRELAGRLALQLHLLREGLRDLDETSPVEIAVAVEPAFDSSAGERQAGAEWSRRIAAMYRGWARERNMQTVELEGSAGQAPVVIFSGFGAHRRLSREAGLHVLEGGENGAGRAAARVLAVSVPPGEMPRQRLRALLAEALTAVPRTGTVVRRYRLGASPLVRNADGTWRSGKADAILAGNFDLLAVEA